MKICESRATKGATMNSPRSSILAVPARSMLVAVLALAAANAAEPETVRFNRDVRPILSNTCFYCHGPDEKKREAKLRLDRREEALKKAESGEVPIVPGKPDESEVIRRLFSSDRDDVMPPPKAHKDLTKAQKETIRRWIAEGAKYESHWAFMPLDRSEPPPVKETAWAKNPIDQFILARLEHDEIKPSPEADPATLCRRLYLDLTGLLPAPEEVTAFTKAADVGRDAAVAALADKLLASPHFGERWGRHWLDQARYADSNGYTIDNERAMWPYRDWVIKALNDDMPFDQFTIEQLAGDLLPKPVKSQIIATAFHRNTLINQEGGVDREQFRNEAVVDRVSTTGAVWLGLTVGCAQCHTHKFDPITQREFYEMFAFFNQGTDVNNTGATVRVVHGEVFGKPVAVRAAPAVDATKLQAAWEKEQLAKDAGPEKPPASTSAERLQWSPAQYEEYDTASGAGFQLLEDNSLLSDGGGSFNDTYRIVAKTRLKKIAAVRLRVLTHDSLPKRGPGLAGNGNFVLTDFEADVGGADQPFASAFADHEQPNFPASAAIDDERKTGWAINVGKGSKAKMNADHEAVFVFARPVEPGGRGIEFKLHHDANEKYLIGRFALEFSGTAPASAPKQDAALLAALRTPVADRDAAQRKVVLDAFQTTSPQAKAAMKTPPNPDIADLMVMKELDAPRPTFIHIRGDFLRNDEKTGPLNPGGIHAVPPVLEPAAGRTRLDLARWLVDKENPLTPRVTMNRMWMRYFGRGIVETEEDFGAQGSPPTHP